MNIVFHSSQFNLSEWQQAFDKLSGDIILQSVDQVAMTDIDVLLIWKPTVLDWSAASNLQLVVWLGAGVDVTNPKLQLPSGVPQERLKDGGMKAAMCDYAHYAVLHYQRRFDRFLEAQRQSHWIIERDYKRKSDISIGVLGLGHLGMAVAEYLANQGYPVSGWSRSPKNHENVHSYAGDEQLEPFLKQCDLLINMLPHTTATHHLLDEQRLRQLPQHSAIISLSRGAIIDTQAMVNLIDQGHLRGAFMDVFEQEPLDKASPLWQHPKIIITPHQSAPTQTLDSAREIIHLIQGL